MELKPKPERSHNDECKQLRFQRCFQLDFKWKLIFKVEKGLYDRLPLIENQKYRQIHICVDRFGHVWNTLVRTVFVCVPIIDNGLIDYFFLKISQEKSPTFHSF